MDWMNSTGLVLVISSAALLMGLTMWRRRRTPVFRNIPAFANLQRAIGLAVEDGTRLHFSLGRASLVTSRGASALAGLSLLRRVGELTSGSDRPPVVTTGDAVLALLSQETLQTAYRAAGDENQYDPTLGRLVGLTPFAYAAGALPVMRDEGISANILIGDFGVEAALLTAAADQSNAYTLAVTDSLPALALMYATAQDPLVGEELYAAGAYVQAGPAHEASLQVQDVLRWLLVGLMLLGVVLSMAGVV